MNFDGISGLKMNVVSQFPYTKKTDATLSKIEDHVSLGGGHLPVGSFLTGIPQFRDSSGRPVDRSEKKDGNISSITAEETQHKGQKYFDEIEHKHISGNITTLSMFEGEGIVARTDRYKAGVNDQYLLYNESYLKSPSNTGSRVPVTLTIMENSQVKENAGHKFASNYTVQEIMTDPVKAKAFEQDYLKGESEYFSLARDEKTGLIFDGYNLDEKTGLIKDVRFWSAPSKESLDLGICIKALQGDEKAALVVSKNNPSKAKQVASDILKKKMDSYMDFHKKNPGYGGFLPWIYIKDDVTPASDWVGAIPGLDNGEWVWSVLVAEKTLRKEGFPEIADKYKEYSDILTSKLGKIFYDKEAGKIRADVQVVNPESPDTEYKTSKNIPGKCDYLGDFHEGFMLTLFVLLFGKEISENDQKKILENVHTKRVESKHGTTWEAWCGSAHESWAYLFLPFRDIPEYKDLFRIREEIRTQNAAERGYPGLGASTNEPGGTGYLSACGIEGIGTMEPVHNDKFAIYGAFPLLQECSDKTEGNYGLAWLLNMLKADKMQGPLGGGESATNDGKKACCVKTVDGTFPNLLAMMGGIEHETGDMLKDYGLYDKFKGIMENKYKEAFGSEPLKEPKGLALPSVSVPVDSSGDYI